MESLLVSVIINFVIYNGNWTEWSAIWSEIVRGISKSEERAARVRFEITSMISDQNCTTPSSITTLLQPFWNRRIQSVPIFYEASEDIASQSWKNLQICMVGWGRRASLCPPPYQRLYNFATLRIYVFVNFQQITFKLGTFTNFKALFSVVWTDFR